MKLTADEREALRDAVEQALEFMGEKIDHATTEGAAEPLRRQSDALMSAFAKIEEAAREEAKLDQIRFDTMLR